MSGRRQLAEGLGLAILALFFGALMLYGALAVGAQAQYLRAAVYGLLALIGLYWGLRITLTELIRYRNPER